MNDLTHDFTPTGLKVEGAYENDRNANNRKLFADIIKEVYGADQCIIGHHLVYQVNDKRGDGFDYLITEEIPSADALIFDHDAAKKLWGKDKFQDVLRELAGLPVPYRDQRLSDLYYGRSK